MRFGRFGLDDAIGVRLAHTLRLPGRTLRKGRVLDAEDIAALGAAGFNDVDGARLAADEADEDTAAALAAAAFAGPGIVAQAAAKGRCNLKAAADGVLLVDAERVRAANRIDEALTLATSTPWRAVRAGEVVATVKTIPFAVANATIHAWRAVAASIDTTPLRIAPFAARRVALIATTSTATTEKLLANTTAVTRARLEALGSALALDLRCPHDAGSLRAALTQVAAAGAEIILIAGASVSKDRGDVVPAAIAAAGGEIVHFGMPVEPGNMLLHARLGDIPVVNLPGCARSRRTNGFDWLLQRLLAGLSVTATDIMDMGIGGLIHSGDADAADEGIPPAARPPRVAALVLAAGRSSRMGARNKLLCEVDGGAMVCRAADAALGSRCVQTLVVTGHQAPEVESALGARPVSLVRNPDYADGMATSLRCGLRALPRDLDGVVVLLGDMPGITASHVDRLLAAFDLAAPAIVAPERGGRRGNPVLWPVRHFGEMMALEGDQGARALLGRYGDNLLTVPIDDDAIFADVDTPADLDAACQGLGAGDV